MEEGADGDVHGGPAAAAPRTQVPQQVPRGRRGALEAAPLSPEQQRPLTAGRDACDRRDEGPGEDGAWGTSSRVFSALDAEPFGGGGGGSEDGPAHPGSCTAGKTQAAGMLLLGVVTILGGPGGLPPVLGGPPAGLMFETTEDKDFFSWPHTHFGTHEPRTGDDHYSSVFTSDIKHILDLPGWHATVLSVANGSPRGRHILPRNSRCGFSTSWLQVTADGRPAGWFFCASQTRLRAVLGLKAEDAFWDGCAWALTVRLHPQVWVCPPPQGALGALGTEGAAPEDTEPVGTASARPLETLTAIPKARPAWGFKLQGNNDLQKSSSTRAALSRVWVHRDVWGPVCWVSTAPVA